MKLRVPVRQMPDALLRSGSAAIGLSAILAVWVAFGVTHSYIRNTALTNARNETANLARAFEEQITRSVKAIDQSLMFVRESWARDPDGFDINSWARNASAVADFAIQLTIVQPDGWTRDFNATPRLPSVDLRDREHIRFQLESPGDELFISRPVVGRLSRRSSIQFTRKLFNAKGEFDGIAVVSVDPSYLTRFYSSFDLGSTGAVTLFGTDGIVRAVARRNASAAEVAADLGKTVPITPSQQPVSAKGRVTVIDFDNVRRVTSFRAVRAYPLIVAVGLGESEVLTDYNVLHRTDTVGAIVLTLLLLAATAGMLLHQRRHAIARDKLRESERLHAEKSSLLETALEHMNQGIIMINGDGRLQICNRRASAMLDLPAEIIAPGVSFRDVIRYQWAKGEFDVPGNEVMSEDGWLDHFGLRGVPQVYERTRPSGETLEIRSMPLQDGGVVRTYTDISVRKAFEEDLRDAHDQARSAARAKSEFLAVMSHEIRSPLSGLVGALDLLSATKLDRDQAHMADLARGSAHNLLSILNEILDFSKIEAGALTLSLEPVDLRGLIAEVTGPHALVAHAHNVALRYEIDPALPQLIRTDRLRFGQIVTNLLSNAVKFTSRGAIVLSAVRERSEAGDDLVLTVRDTGLGMSAATLERLFQPFTQADGSSSRVADGTGLGLCISHRLAALLDGTLTVVSEPGVGSCFTLTIRCVAEQRIAALAPPGLHQGDEELLAGMRVLVVDDNATNQWLTGRQLLTLGAAVETVSNGYAALDLLDRLDFDVIVTDCHMPGLDGVALAEAVRNGGRSFSDRPIVGLTADVTREQARRCVESGMNDLLYKPVDRARLAQSILELVPRPEHLPIVTRPTTSGPDTATAADTPVFDATTLRDLFDDGDPAGAEWLRSFCRTAQTQVHNLERTASGPPIDRSFLAETAHALVGASLSVGAARLAGSVRTLERAAVSASQAEIASLVQLVEEEHRAAVAAIDAALSELVPT